jgi:CDP-glucose 4,6-dehydratase
VRPITAANNIACSDKCYENDSRKEGYIETDSMGGYDPYSSSKGCAELVTSFYLKSNLLAEHLAH